MPFLPTTCGELYFSDTGPTDTAPLNATQGPPLILLHANPGDSRDYDAVIATLAQHHRVIALDWPGYGNSQMPEQPSEVGHLRFYQALLAVLDQLNPGPAILIGNSVGGNVAARLAMNEPGRVAGLILVSPGGFTPHNAITRLFCRFMGSRFALSPGRWAGLLLRHKNPQTRSMLDRAATLYRQSDRLQLNRALWRSFVLPEHDLRPQAHAIHCPVLLLFGRHDIAIPATKDGVEAQRLLPAAEFHATASGHALFAEQPELFLRYALPFLQRVASATPQTAAQTTQMHRRDANV